MAASRKVALVTGATSGIGASTARRFARDGYIVGTLGRDPAATKRIAAEIEAGGGRAVALVADVRDRATLAAQIEALVEGENGGLDAVVAAAGVVDAGATHAIEPAAWDAVIDVNLTGVFNVAHFTMPALCRRKGCFIAIGAAAGAFAAQGMAAYTASKHGLNGLVKALALEYGHLGVRANVISPGFVETRMAQKLLDSLSDEERIAMRKRTPLDRFAKADEVADVIAWFASDQANFANGALFALDGGVTAGWYMPPA